MPSADRLAFAAHPCLALALVALGPAIAKGIPSQGRGMGP